MHTTWLVFSFSNASVLSVNLSIIYFCCDVPRCQRSLSPASLHCQVFKNLQKGRHHSQHVRGHHTHQNNHPKIKYTVISKSCSGAKTGNGTQRESPNITVAFPVIRVAFTSWLSTKIYAKANMTARQPYNQNTRVRSKFLFYVLILLRCIVGQRMDDIFCFTQASRFNCRDLFKFLLLTLQ